MNDRVVKEFFKGHEFTEIEIPSGWIIHPTLPCILLDRIDLLQKGEMETIIEIVDSLPSVSFSVDVLARSRNAIKKRQSIGDKFMIEIIKKGKILYARDH